MRYLLLAGACLFFSIQFIFPKLFQRRTDGTVHAAMWSNLMNGISMFAIFFALNGFALAFSRSSVLFAVVYSLSSIICTVASLIGMVYTSVAAITFYTLLGGVVLPFFYGVAVLGEKPSVWRWTGAVLLVAALVIPFVLDSVSAKKKHPGLSGATASGGNSLGNGSPAENGSVENRSAYSPVSKTRGVSSRLKVILCAAGVFVTNGLISIVTTAAMREPDAVSDRDFLLIATLIRIACSVAALAFFWIKNRTRTPLPTDTRTGTPAGAKLMLLLLFFCFCYALLNGAGNLCSLNCAKTMDASLQYPVISAACIIFSAVFGFLIFREKPSKGSLIGIAVSVVGIILFIF
ncbi:MAG: EamA family transporter [Clostridia bacterium]|nr:EamA family transporter [Clostridia bacterium]